METKRVQVFKIFKSRPNEGFSVKDITELTSLRKGQVRRALQFYMEKKFIISVPDNYSGIGRKGKIVYYILSHEIHSKLG